MPKTRQQDYLRGFERRIAALQSVPTGNKLCQKLWVDQPRVWFNLLESKFKECEFLMNYKQVYCYHD